MNLQAVFRSTAQAPLDNRQVVQTKADLINAATFEGFAYEGMLVVTTDTSAVYVLNDITKVTSADYSGWTELATSASASSAASVVSLLDGNTAYVDLQPETAADGHKIYKLGLKIVDVADATESNTGVADAYDVKSYVDSAIDGIETIIDDNEEVIAAALNELKVTADDHESRISAIEDEIGPDGLIKDYTVTVTPSTPADSSNILKTYTFTQLGETIGTIDIPKDLVVTEGKTVEVVYDETAQHYYDDVADPTHQNPIDALLNLDEQQDAGYAAGTYVRLSIANQTAPIYIKVTDLVDVYTGNATDTRDIVVSVDSATNVISAAIGSKSNLAAALVTLGEVEQKLNGIEEGAEVNVIETVKVNGTALQVVSKAVDVTVPTKLTDLTNDGNFVTDANYVHTDNNYTTNEKNKLSGIEEGAEVNIIETVKVNGTALSVTNKAVDVTVPTKLTDLTNDGDFVTDANYVHTDNNYTTNEKNKLSGIAENAQVNVIEGVQVDGVDLTIDANKKVNISTSTLTGAIAETNANVERVEKVTAAALNDLNSRLVDAESAITGLPIYTPATYLTDAITDSEARTITVSAADHGCGSFPIVQVYAGNEVVNANITVDVATNSDVTVTWEIVPSTTTPIRVRILG